MTTFHHWQNRSQQTADNFEALKSIVLANRNYQEPASLSYGDYGLEKVAEKLRGAINRGERIALYADYDVDGTMSCVSWIWFLRAIGHENYVHYIPCRFKEGYGLNLQAVTHLVENEQSQLIITMDTGITANAEAAFCKERGVEFICTDHHVIQPNKMPDCTILNPKMHDDPLFQELCGCGITFVLLRRLAQDFAVPDDLWSDLLSLVGMATICDVVPLNGVNHQLAKRGVAALGQTKRPILNKLKKACVDEKMDEKDIGFRLGPRINAVGRLEHADSVIRAFVEDQPDDLIRYMAECNEKRKTIQASIVTEAQLLVEKELEQNSPIVFLGGDWHPGVVGIAASKISEQYWKPTWLFQIKDGKCKGSARSIPGFDVTAAMTANGELFDKFGGHQAAGGFSFPLENLEKIKEGIADFAEDLRATRPAMWESYVEYDCEISSDLLSLQLPEELNDLKPFGHGFEEPKFSLKISPNRIRYYNDKITGEPKHSAVFFVTPNGREEKIMFFNRIIPTECSHQQVSCLVTAERNTFRGISRLQLLGVDLRYEQASIN